MKVYLDNAATTRVDPAVYESMTPFLKGEFGNPSSIHQWGQKARVALDQARGEVARLLAANADEIIFTSCATESINLAHKGLIEALISSNKLSDGTNLPHLVTTMIEHKAVLESCLSLERRKLASVTYLPVDKYGLVKISDLQEAIRPRTVLVSVMFVNNEMGTIQPIKKIAKLIFELNESRAKRKGLKIYFHTDATQAIQYLDCSVDKLGVDLLSLTGHKLYAPKGVGALYVREGVSLVSQQNGGGQEANLRAGTENVAYIVGLAKAMAIASKDRVQITSRVLELRERLTKGVLKIPGVQLTGHPTDRVAHIASFVIRGVEGEALLMFLSDEGIAVSSGSACTSGSLKPSHVLTSMGIAAEIAHGSLRFSLGKQTSLEEINYALKVLPRVVTNLRKMAPK